MTITLDKVTTEMFKALMKKEGKYDSKKYLSDLFVQLESLLTTNFSKPWQSLAELFLVVSVDLSDFGSYWQHLNTKENGEGGLLSDTKWTVVEQHDASG